MKICQAHQDEPLIDFRFCLFYETRRDYWTGGFGPDGYGPDEESARYIDEMLDKVREKVEANDLR